MTEPTAVVDYAARRIAVALPDAYDEARVHYEQVVYEQVVYEQVVPIAAVIRRK